MNDEVVVRDESGRIVATFIHPDPLPYQAYCIDADCGWEAKFPTYLERSQRVGEHRVRTGHMVTMITATTEQA